MTKNMFLCNLMTSALLLSVVVVVLTELGG